jgi:hypothetical protein
MQLKIPELLSVTTLYFAGCGTEGSGDPDADSSSGTSGSTNGTTSTATTAGTSSTQPSTVTDTGGIDPQCATFTQKWNCEKEPLCAWYVPYDYDSGYDRRPDPGLYADGRSIPGGTSSATGTGTGTGTETSPGTSSTTGVPGTSTSGGSDGYCRVNCSALSDDETTCEMFGCSWYGDYCSFPT